MPKEDWRNKRDIGVSELVISEREIFSKLPIDGSSFFVIRKLAQFDENLQKGAVVHLGSGFSSFVPELLNKGIEAFAVDPRYDNLFTHLIEAKFERSKSSFDQNQYQAARNVLNMFKQSRLARHNHYKSCYLLDLRFRDSYANNVISVNFLSEYAHDYHIFELSVREVLRVTAPRGKIVLAPFHTESGAHNKYAENHAKLVEILTKEGLITVNILEPFAGFNDSRLIINKV